MQSLYETKNAMVVAQRKLTQKGSTQEEIVNWSYEPSKVQKSVFLSISQHFKGKDLPFPPAWVALRNYFTTANSS